MAALNFIQGTAVNDGSVIAPTIAFGSSTTGGSLLLAWMGTNGAPGAVPTDTLGNIWNLVGTSTASAFSSSISLYYVKSNKVGGGANTVTLHSPGGGIVVVGVAEFTLQSLNPFDNFSVTDIPATSGGLTTFSVVPLSETNEEVISVQQTFNPANGNTTASSAVTPGTGFSPGVAQTAGSSMIYGPFASGNQTPSATISSVGATWLNIGASFFSTSSVGANNSFVQGFRSFANKRGMTARKKI